MQTGEERKGLFSVGWNMPFFPVYKTKSSSQEAASFMAEGDNLLFSLISFAHPLSAEWSLALRLQNWTSFTQIPGSLSTFNEAVTAEGLLILHLPLVLQKPEFFRLPPKLMPLCLPDYLNTLCSWLFLKNWTMAHYKATSSYIMKHLTGKDTFLCSFKHWIHSLSYSVEKKNTQSEERWKN